MLERWPRRAPRLPVAMPPRHRSWTNGLRAVSAVPAYAPPVTVTVSKRLLGIAAALAVGLSAAVSAAVLLLPAEAPTLNAQDDRAVARATGYLEQNTRHAAEDAAADRAFVEELRDLVALQQQATGSEKRRFTRQIQTRFPELAGIDVTTGETRGLDWEMIDSFLTPQATPQIVTKSVGTLVRVLREETLDTRIPSQNEDVRAFLRRLESSLSRAYPDEADRLTRLRSGFD